MIAGKIDVPVGKIVRENVRLTVELRVTGARWFKLRAWLGARLLKLAGAVIGCEMEIRLR